MSFPLNTSKPKKDGEDKPPPGKNEGPSKKQIPAGANEFATYRMTLSDGSVLVAVAVNTKAKSAVPPNTELWRIMGSVLRDLVENKLGDIASLDIVLTGDGTDEEDLKTFVNETADPKVYDLEWTAMVPVKGFKALQAIENGAGIWFEYKKGKDRAYFQFEAAPPQATLYLEGEEAFALAQQDVALALPISNLKEGKSAGFDRVAPPVGPFTGASFLHLFEPRS